MRINYRLTYLLICLCFACNSETSDTSIDGVWVGSMRNSFWGMPISSVIRIQENNKIYISGYNHLDTIDWSLKGHNLSIDTNSYIITKLDQDELMFEMEKDTNHMRDFIYKRPRNCSPPITQSFITNGLTNNVWVDKQSVVSTGFDVKCFYHFEDSTYTKKREYFYNGELLTVSDFEQRCYHEEFINGHAFLFYQSGYDSCHIGYAPQQIIETTDSTFTTLVHNHRTDYDWNSSRPHNTIYYATEKNTIPLDGAQEFKPCLDAFTLESYQQSLVFHEMGDYALNDYYEKGFTSSNSDVSGTLTIRFVVNCKGEVGRFRVFQMDKHYNPVLFPSDIVVPLLTLTAKIKGWDPILQRDANRIYDTNKHFHFIIESGQLKEVFGANG